MEKRDDDFETLLDELSKYLYDNNHQIKRSKKSRFDIIFEKLNRHNTDFNISPYTDREDFLYHFEFRNREKLPEDILQECLNYADKLRLHVPVIFNVDHFCYILENFTDGKIKFSGKTPEKRKAEILKMAFYDPDSKRGDTKPIWWREFSIPKRSGGERRIDAPRDPLKQIQRWILRNILMKVKGGVTQYAYGFVKKRSIVHNAEPHVGKKIILNIDIEDFFPSIKEDRVRKLFRGFGYTDELSRLFAGLCTYRGFLPQGAPTSPAISNMVCRRLDLRLGKFCEKYDLTYTRYADDITISGDYDFLKYKNIIMKIIEDEGFRISHKKLRVTGRGKAQIVTGLVVNEKVNIRRDEIRTLRAIIHNCKKKGVLKHVLERDDIEDKLNFVSWLYGKLGMVQMVRPEIAERFREELKSIDWSEFIGWREKQLSLFQNEEGILKPNRPYSNERKLIKIIRSCKRSIKWIDRYFSEFGLDRLCEYLDRDKIKDIKILTSDRVFKSIENFERFLEKLRRFQKEMREHGIKCECRVMSKEVYHNIHDRWIIIDDKFCYNVPSTDTVARGQYSSIYLEKDVRHVPFDDFWNKSVNIFKDRERIKKIIKEDQ